MAVAVDHANIGEFVLDSASSTIALTTTSAVSAGGFIILTATWSTGGGAVTASSCSGGGLTWTIDKQAKVGTSTDIGLAIISAQAPSGLASGTTITLTLSGSSGGGRSLCGTSFTGVATSTPAETTDSKTVHSGTSGTAWATNSVTVSAGDLIYTVTANFQSNITSTPTSPAIETHDVNGGVSSFDTASQYQIQASAGSYTNAGTWSSNVNTDGNATVAYKVAAGGTTDAIVPASITATSSMTGGVQALKHVTPASVTASSAVTGSVVALRAVSPASILATSTVSAGLRALRSVMPAAITATSDMSGTVGGGSTSFVSRLASLHVG